MDVMNKIATALAERAGSAADAITPETKFQELNLDSLDVAELIMDLEDTFSVTIDMSTLDGTVGSLVKQVEEAGK